MQNVHSYYGFKKKNINFIAVFWNYFSVFSALPYKLFQPISPIFNKKKNSLSQTLRNRLPKSSFQFFFLNVEWYMTRVYLHHCKYQTESKLESKYFKAYLDLHDDLFITLLLIVNYNNNHNKSFNIKRRF